MMKIRIGNDIKLQWILLNDAEPYIVQKDAEVRLVDVYNRPVQIESSIKDNIVTVIFRGKHQYSFGKYSLLLVENDGENDMVTVDYMGAFELTKHSNFPEVNKCDNLLFEMPCLTSYVDKAGGVDYDDTEIKKQIAALETGKVDKVDGKQLSTEDFTTAEKEKLASISEGAGKYDDTQVKADIQANTDKITAIENAGYLTAVPDNYVTDEKLDGMAYTTLAEVGQQGYTTLDAVRQEGYTTLEEVNRQGFVTQYDIDSAGYITSIPYNYVTDEKLQAAGYTTLEEVQQQNYLTNVPVADSINYGGIKADPKTEDMTQPVGIDLDGKLYTKAGGTGEQLAKVYDISELKQTKYSSFLDAARALESEIAIYLTIPSPAQYNGIILIYANNTDNKSHAYIYNGDDGLYLTDESYWTQLDGGASSANTIPTVFNYGPEGPSDLYGAIDKLNTEVKEKYPNHSWEGTILIFVDSALEIETWQLNGTEITNQSAWKLLNKTTQWSTVFNFCKFNKTYTIDTALAELGGMAQNWHDRDTYVDSLLVFITAENNIEVWQADDMASGYDLGEKSHWKQITVGGGAGYDDTQIKADIQANTDNITANTDKITAIESAGYATKVTLTQSEYDQLPEKDANTIYVISDSKNLEIPTKVSELKNDSNFLTGAATATTYGGIKADPKTEDMTQPVGIDGNGKLFTKAGADAELTNRVTALENAGYLTAIPDNYVTDDKLQAAGYLTAIPDNYVTDDKLQAAGYLTEVPSFLINKINGINEYNISKITGKIYKKQFSAFPDVQAALNDLLPILNEQDKQCGIIMSLNYTTLLSPTKPIYAKYKWNGDDITNTANWIDVTNVTIPSASATTYGGIKADPKTEDMTQAVGIDVDGKLYTKAGAGYDDTQIKADIQANTDKITAIESAGYLTAIPENYVTDEKLQVAGYTTLAEVQQQNYLTAVPSETLDRITALEQQIVGMQQTINEINTLIK